MAHASIDISSELQPGDTATIQFIVEDDVLQEPFVNVVQVRFIPRTERPPGGSGRPRTRRGKGAQDDLRSSGIQLPKHSIVREQQWSQYGFDRFSGCQIIQDEDEENEDHDVYSFYINGDNIYLRTDIKHSNEDPKLMEAQFVYGTILIGLGLIRQYRDIEKQAESKTANDGDDSRAYDWVQEITVEQYVRITTRALAPFVLPMINRLGSLSEDDVDTSGEIGDDQ